MSEQHRTRERIVPILGTVFGALVAFGALYYLKMDASVLLGTHPGGLGNFNNYSELLNYDRTNARALLGDGSGLGFGLETARRSIRKLIRTR